MYIFLFCYCIPLVIVIAIPVYNFISCYYCIPLVIVNAQVKHIYELTPTQARELRKLAENIDKDYIVSAGHKDDKETISF